MRHDGLKSLLTPIAFTLESLLLFLLGCVLNGSWARLGRFLELTWSKLAPKMAPRGPKMLPRWAREAPRCSKMLQDEPKMLPRWLQDAPRGSRDGPKRPQEEGQKRRKTFGFYRFSYIEGIMEQVGSQDGPKRPQEEGQKP